MNKKIPKVFRNEVNSNGNNENIFVSDNKNNGSFDGRNINQKLASIFNSSSFVYKADVNIKLKNETVVKRIVGRNSTHLITIDNELIPISDIVDISCS